MEQHFCDLSYQFELFDNSYSIVFISSVSLAIRASILTYYYPKTSFCPAPSYSELANVLVQRTILGALNHTKLTDQLDSRLGTISNFAGYI